MPDVSVLSVLLHGKPVGNLTLVQGLRTLFTFDQAYVDDPDRYALSLSFKDQFGGLLTDIKPVQRVVPPFFSNLLPEGSLRTYLAKQANVNEGREFFLLWLLGRDLPGAVTVHPAEGEELPPGLNDQPIGADLHKALRFSLAGVQLKFSALKNGGRGGGLTIPAEGVGGHWIVKLPSTQFPGMPENEFSMMTIAAMMGMDVPEIQLLDLDKVEGLPTGIGEVKGQAYAVRRFDRNLDGSVHIEDFAQVFGLFPDDKYGKRTYRSIGNVIGIEAGDQGVAEYVRRLVFSTLIGNADMHLKNWSLIYPDRKNAALSPAYDLVSTIPYIADETAALRYARTKKMTEFSRDELAYLAAKALLPEKLVMDTAKDTVQRFREVWAAEAANLPMAKAVTSAVDAHLGLVPIYREF